MAKQGTANPPSVRAGKRRKVCDLAYATFEAFEKYINTYDCGIKYAPGKTCHIITREERALLARYTAGEQGLTRSNGYPFEPRQFFQDVLTVRHVHEQICESRLYYYTSGTRAYGLAYLDVDAHYQFQTDAKKALALLLDLFGHDVLFARDSNRGENGYLKVWHGGRVALFNETLRDLQRLLHLYFRQHEILCDIEVKGTITTAEKCGSLAKLPFSTFDPMTGRQSWDRDMLADFLSKPDITLDSLVRFVHRLGGFIDPDRAEQLDRHVRRLKDQEKGVGEEVEYESLMDAVMALGRERLAQAGRSGRTATPEVTRAAAEPSTTSPPGTTEVVPVREVRPVRCHPQQNRFPEVDEPDSFHRQFWALLPLHRSLRRVATEDEALEFIRVNRLHTGDWSDNLSRRQARVRWILKHQAQTFDASNCGTGHVEVGKFDAWAKANFPQAITRKKRTLDGEKLRKVATWQDVATYLAVFEFSLETAAQGDKGVPHERVMKLWQSLYAKGVVGTQAKDRKVKVIREMLAAWEVIRITDRNYRPGRSMTYDYGPNYPGKEFWRRPRKDERRQAACFDGKSRPRSAVPAFSTCNESLVKTSIHHNNTTQHILNTVPTLVGAPDRCPGAFHPSTGPPGCS